MDPLEYRFRITALTPGTIPMLRLATYMVDLAKLLGSTDHVHFDRVEEGSVQIVARVDETAKPIVSPRIRAAARGEGDGASAYRRLNDALAQDHAEGQLLIPRGEVIVFPGKKRSEVSLGGVRQPTTVQGKLVRIEGGGDRVAVGIEDEAGLAKGGVTVKASLAVEMAKHFHCYVRLHGSGRWRRTSDGTWQMETLDGESFEVLQTEHLKQAIASARSRLKPGTAAKAIKVIQDLRDS
jgi:hypothetical protein